MILKNINNIDLEFELEDINYVCPIDIVLGNEMYDYLTKYFSSYKYDNDYLQKYCDNYPEIINDKNVVIGRDNYLCIGVNSYKDIDELLQSKKGTIFYDYNNNLLENIDIKKEIEIIETAYINITNKIAEEYTNGNVINIKDFILKSDKLLAKEIEFSINYNSTILEKFKLLVELFSIETNREIIFYLNNVDSYLSLDDMIDIIKIAKTRKNIKIIIQSNHPAYLDYTEAQKIMFLKDNNIEKLLNNNDLLNKINNNIESSIYIDEKHLISWLKKYSIIFMENNFEIVDLDFAIYQALCKRNCNIDRNQDFSLENSVII